MKYYTIYNNLGEILRSGQVPDEAFELQQGEGEFIIEAASDPSKDSVDTVLAKIIPEGKPVPPINMDYQSARAAQYPSIPSQLDMMWHSMDSGQIPKAEPFYSTIKAVKEAYPKDNSVVPGSVLTYNEGGV